MGGESGAEFFFLEVMRQESTTHRVLRRAAYPGHDGPKEKLKIALHQPHKNEADPDARVADAQNMMTRQNPREGTGAELKQAAHCARDAEHDAKLAVAKVEITQHQRKHQRFQRPLSVIDAMGQTHQSKRGSGMIRVVSYGCDIVNVIR